MLGRAGVYPRARVNFASTWSFLVGIHAMDHQDIRYRYTFKLQHTEQKDETPRRVVSARKDDR